MSIRPVGLVFMMEASHTRARAPFNLKCLVIILSFQTIVKKNYDLHHDLKGQISFKLFSF